MYGELRVFKDGFWTPSILTRSWPNARLTRIESSHSPTSYAIGASYAGRATDSEHDLAWAFRAEILLASVGIVGADLYSVSGLLADFRAYEHGNVVPDGEEFYECPDCDGSDDEPHHMIVPYLPPQIKLHGQHNGRFARFTISEYSR